MDTDCKDSVADSNRAAWHCFEEHTESTAVGFADNYYNLVAHSLDTHLFGTLADYYNSD